MITITDNAVKKIKQQINKRGKGLGIRVGVKTTGCSGLAYMLEFVDTPNPADTEIKCDGCSLFIDPKSCPYVKGMQVDYLKQGLNEGFQFINPNEKDRCGCGESFRV